MLKPEQEHIDLGTMKFGEVRSFTYRIQNTTGKTMRIDKIQVSCSSCTKASLPTKICGEQSELLKVTFTPGVVGIASKYVDVFYDGDQVMRVTFKAIVHG